MRTLRTTAAFVLLAASLALGLAAQVAAPSYRWVGREGEFEEYLRTAPVERYKDISLGVTRPTRAWLASGGLVESVAWKPLRPGMYHGFYESYKSEIAAYEMDKLLQLHMVPPAVERRISGITGAMIMWLDGMRMWRDLEKTKPATPRWNLQMVRMKMFDALIGNIDRNAGNILIDGDWNVYLIDHSRAFVTDKKPPATANFTFVDRQLWDRMQALDEAAVRQAIGPWVRDASAITAFFARRERMAKSINDMVAKRGAVRVYIQ